MVVLHALELLLLGMLSLAQVAKSRGTIGLPNCSQACATTAANAAGCNAKDTSCLCASKSFISATLQCSSNSCSSADQSKVAEYLQSTCHPVTTTTNPISGSPGTSTGTFTGTKTISNNVTITTSSAIGVTTATNSTLATSTIATPPTSISSASSSIISGPISNTATVTIQTVLPSANAGCTASRFASGGVGGALAIGLTILGLQSF